MEYNNPVFRAVKIIQLFAIGRKITVNELYDTFDRKVDKRTIQRDLIKISDAGIPLVSKKGHKNENIWIIDRPSSHYLPTPLTLDEYVVLNYMKKALPVFKNTPVENAYNNLMDKMDQLLSGDVYEEVSSKNKLFENIFDTLEFGYYDYSAMRTIIQQITDAIINSRICEITYQSLQIKKPKTYKFEPYKILTYKGALYLVAFRRKYQEFNHLAVHRIKKIVITEEPFERDQEYDSKQFVKDRFGMTSIKAEEVVLLIDKEIVPHIEGRIWHHSQKMKVKKDGSMILTMKVSISDELLGWILKWMGYITVVKPKKMRDEIVKIIKEMKNKF